MAAFALVVYFNLPWKHLPKNTPTLNATPITTVQHVKKKSITPTPVRTQKVLKDVGEAFMDRFGLTEPDFEAMQKAGVTIIEGNFDICANNTDVSYFLDTANRYGLKVIMNAGAGEAEWGYTCEGTFPESQKPVWQQSAVKTWVNKWKNHPALYAWDTSNEAGSVFPNAAPENMLTLVQLQKAYADVKRADPSHPVMIRMNGWYFYDQDYDFFREENPFGAGVADIVMVNAYSNVEDYYSDFVTTVMRRAKASISGIDPHITFITALGAWSEPPLWVYPSIDHFKTDLNQARALNVAGVAFFKYGARGSEWYLPQNAPTLWKMIAAY